MQECFFVVTPGLEDLAQRELHEKWQLLFKLPIESKKVYGGIELKEELENILSIQGYLKIPTRILLRLTKFRCRDFPKLYHKLKKFNWNEFVSAEQVEFQASSQQSRLMHSQRIIDTAEKAFQDYRRAFTAKKTEQKKQEIYLRFNQDECQVSLNLSGDALYKRGYKKFVSDAPLRESIASAMYYSLLCNSCKPTKILDPFCGAGTLLIEANEFYNANAYRFKKARLKDQNLTLFGNDISEKALESCKKNLNKILIDANLSCSDYQKIPMRDYDLIISNPPYGKRISNQISNLPLILKEKFQCPVALLLPSSFNLSSGDLLFQTSNGGILVDFRVWR